MITCSHLITSINRKGYHHAPTTSTTRRHEHSGFFDYVLSLTKDTGWIGEPDTLSTTRVYSRGTPRVPMTATITCTCACTCHTCTSAGVATPPPPDEPWDALDAGLALVGLVGLTVGLATARGAWGKVAVRLVWPTKSRTL